MPGTDIFIINIDRVSAHDDDVVANRNTDFSRLRSTIRIPLSGLIMSGNPYGLVMVIHQESHTGKDGEDDPQSGHCYTHK